MLENKLAELQKLALQDNDAAWSKIDVEIPTICNDFDVISWACTDGMFSRQYQLQHLAASLLEKASWGELSDTIGDHLFMLMNGVIRPEQRYAQFRMACALYNNGWRRPEVVQVLRNAPEKVKDIAQKYLAQQ